MIIYTKPTYNNILKYNYYTNKQDSDTVEHTIMMSIYLCQKNQVKNYTVSYKYTKSWQ